MKMECPRCGEIELCLEVSTKDEQILEYYCYNCPYMECHENEDYDPTPDEQGEPPISWFDYASRMRSR